MTNPNNLTTYYAYSSGKVYKIAQNEDILVRREYGIKLGEVRMFFYFSHNHRQCMYFAERKFKSTIHPFIAPRIWWRKIKKDTYVK